MQLPRNLLLLPVSSGRSYISGIEPFESVSYLQACRSILLAHQNQLQEDTLILLNSSQPIPIFSVSDVPLRSVLLRFANIPSTMLLSAEWPRQLFKQADCFMFMADRQSSGQGMHTNTWQSPPGNMYLTVLLEIDLQLAPFLPIVVSNCVVSRLRRSLGEKASLVGCKWVNDVFLKERKISGVLIRCSNEAGRFYAQIGVGINVYNSPLQGSTCIKDYITDEIDLFDFTVDFATELTRRVLALKRGPLSDELEEYNRNLIYRQQIVDIFDQTLQTVIQSGIFKGITAEGHAILDVSGKKVVVSDGRMRLNMKAKMDMMN